MSSSRKSLKIAKTKGKPRPNAGGEAALTMPGRIKIFGPS